MDGYSRSQQCSDDGYENSKLPPIMQRTVSDVKCPMDNCPWVGDIKKLEVHKKTQHQAFVAKPVERESSACTHYLITKEVIDERNLLSGEGERLHKHFKSLKEELHRKRKKLSKAEESVKIRKAEIRKIKDSIKKLDDRYMVAKEYIIADVKSFQDTLELQKICQLKDQLATAERELLTAMQKVKIKRRETEETAEQTNKIKLDLDEHTKKVQTLQSNSSKFEEPVQVHRQSVVCNGESAANSIASLGQATATLSLQGRALALNTEISEQVSTRSHERTRKESEASKLPTLEPHINTTSRPVLSKSYSSSSCHANARSRRSSTSTAFAPVPPQVPRLNQATAVRPQHRKLKRRVSEPARPISISCQKCDQLQAEVQKKNEIISRKDEIISRLSQECLSNQDLYMCT